MKSKKMVLALVSAVFVIGVAANSHEPTKSSLPEDPIDADKPITSPVPMNLSLTAPDPAAAPLLASLLASLHSARPENNESMQGTECEVTYGIGASGTIVTGWMPLGKVYFPNKRQKCKNKAIANCQQAKSLVPIYAPVGSANMQSICNQGKVSVYFDTRLGSLKYTKDGTCDVNVACTRPPCPPWTGYVP